MACVLAHSSSTLSPLGRTLGIDGRETKSTVVSQNLELRETVKLTSLIPSLSFHGFVID
jgi:hypothetical protein